MLAGAGSPPAGPRPPPAPPGPSRRSGARPRSCPHPASAPCRARRSPPPRAAGRALGGDLRDDRVRALADVRRALVQHEPPVAVSPMRMVEGLGSEVLPQPYQHDASPPRAAGDRPAGVPRRRLRQRRAPRAPRSASRQAPMPPRADLPVAVAWPSASAFSTAEGQPVHARRLGQVVVQRLLRRSRPAARRSRGRRPRPGRWCGSPAPRATDSGHQIGAGRMHRHAVGHRRPPARIGPVSNSASTASR
jgi:hypothetical protein